MSPKTEHEEAEIRGLFANTDTLLRVAGIIESEHPDEAAAVREAAHNALAAAHPVRISIAASLLGMDEKTVRAWTREGVLTAEGHSPLGVGPERLYEVLQLVQDLRAAGRDRKLLESVWYRLQDEALLDRADLIESLEQMRTGQTVSDSVYLAEYEQREKVRAESQKSNSGRVKQKKAPTSV